MLHGYHHDEQGISREFVGGLDLRNKVRQGKQYLEEVLRTKIRVFVPPHNAIGKTGLQAIAQEGLHLGGVAGMRGGWSWISSASIKAWWRIRRWRMNGHTGVPWVLNLGDHKELAGNAITPTSYLDQNLKRFNDACGVNGVFCAATHYWELDHSTQDPDTRTVQNHLQILIQRAIAKPAIQWVPVGTAIEDGLRDYS
jgi:hypothetical protein